MTRARWSLTSLVSGLVFILLGTLFVLDRVEVIVLSAAYVWPILLIGLGLAVLLGGPGRREAEPPGAEPEEPEAPPSERDTGESS